MPLPVISKAIIFSAGLGTRFKPWTDTHPKALAMVNGKSLLQRNVEYLQQYNIRDVVVNVHHFADQVEEAINAAKGWGSNISISCMGRQRARFRPAPFAPMPVAFPGEPLMPRLRVGRAAETRRT